MRNGPSAPLASAGRCATSANFFRRFLCVSPRSASRPRLRITILAICAAHSRCGRSRGSFCLSLTAWNSWSCRRRTGAAVRRGASSLRTTIHRWKVLDRKIDNVANTEARILASGCPGCQMQLNTGLQRRGLPVRVVHPVTLLDEAYGGADGK